MHDLVYLFDLVVVLAVAVAVVALLHRVRIPSIAGFILAGLLVGPHGLRLIDDAAEVEILAEVGVSLLLFGIGLELSLDRLKRLWTLIITGGALQVVLTAGAAGGVAAWLGAPWSTAVFVGFLVAVSSTAIVLRGLEARAELEAPHGRLTLGILIFQDLCVVPMMLAIPVLAGSGGSAGGIALTLLKAAAIIAGVLVAARRVVPFALGFVARTRERHLFVLSVVVVCLGTAWAISSTGVSLALGAFLAGLVVAGSEYRHQALADMISLKDVFTSVFFVSVGMLLVPQDIARNAVHIVLLLVAILFGKSLIVFLVASVLRLSLRVRILAAVSLAQVGEFSFILISAARGTDILPRELETQILAAAILSMFLTPFALGFGPHLAAGVGRLRNLNRHLRIDAAEEAPRAGRQLRDHIIIGGYGFAGRELARAVRECGLPYVVVDLNIDNIRDATEEGHPVFFGDVTSPEVMTALGATRARELVLVINDPSAIARAVQAARSLSDNIHIVVRTGFLLDVGLLEKAGASEIVVSEREAAVEVVSRVLSRCQILRKQVEEEVERVRGASEE
ncbi:MAG: cation:proton antiporter [Phycisphaerales bacterium]|nr:MAG: cation:proton antiporter [Phycisphaerales bacterium]